MLYRGLERAALERLSEREPVGMEEARRPIRKRPGPERPQDRGLDVAAERVGARTHDDEQVERDVARCRHVRFVSGHATAVQQIDELDVLRDRQLLASFRVWSGEDREPTPGPAEDGPGALHPRQRLPGVLVVLLTDC